MQIVVPSAGAATLQFLVTLTSLKLLLVGGKKKGVCDSRDSLNHRCLPWFFFFRFQLLNSRRSVLIWETGCTMCKGRSLFFTGSIHIRCYYFLFSSLPGNYLNGEYDKYSSVVVILIIWCPRDSQFAGAPPHLVSMGTSMPPVATPMPYMDNLNPVAS